MNCSGKLAALRATCVGFGWPISGYLDPDHSVLAACRSAIERLAGEPVTASGTDGCGAPVAALTLRGLASAFGAAVSAQPTSAVGRVAAARRAFPERGGGTGRVVSALLSGVPGLLTKDGAEGVYAGALPGGAAFAVKIDDGAERARGPVVVAVLRRLGVEVPVLDELAEVELLGGGRPVGAVRVVPDLLVGGV
jgi:L-asparaginase II